MPRFQMPARKATIRPTAMSRRGDAHERVLPRRELDTARVDVLVVLNRVDADRDEHDGPRADREDERQDRAQEEVADPPELRPSGSRIEARRLRSSVAVVSVMRLPPTISSPTRCCALGPFSTTPTMRPREITAIRSHRSSNSSRSVEMTIDVTPSRACW